MTLDEANQLVFDARLLVRGWRGPEGRKTSSTELLAALERLDAVELSYPQLQAEIDLIRASFERRNTLDL